MYKQESVGVVSGVPAHTPVHTPVHVHHIQNTNGMKLTLHDVGATVLSLKSPQGHEMIVGDKQMAYHTPHHHHPHFGATVGPLAGRTSTKPFVLPHTTTTYSFAGSENDHVHLHGGAGALTYKIWTSEYIEQEHHEGIKFSYQIPKDDYIDTVSMTVFIGLHTTDNTLTIQYHADASAMVPINLTNHSYFRLSGDTILDHSLEIYASHMYVLDEHGLNTGKLSPVEDTPFDFRSSKAIHPVVTQLQENRQGLDHIWKLDAVEKNSNHLYKAASLRSPEGTMLDTYTSFPAMVCYTGNVLDVYTSGEGPYQRYEAVCFEAQYPPGFTHLPSLPQSYITPPKAWMERTDYVFSY